MEFLIAVLFVAVAVVWMWVRIRRVDQRLETVDMWEQQVRLLTARMHSLEVRLGENPPALPVYGFPLRERVLRWQGLVLLLACILKLFLYDLRNLETMHRILSFVALGLILLAVSWVYTRFRERLRRIL